MQSVKGQSSSQIEPPVPVIHVSPSPHLTHKGASTRMMMVDVLIALVPVLAASVYVFRGYVVVQVATCLAGCLLAELVFSGLRGRQGTLKDCSAVVTAIILAMSLPGTGPGT